MSSSDFIKIKNALGSHKGHAVCKELMYIDLSVIFEKASIESNSARLKTLADFVEFSNPDTDGVREVISLIKQRIVELSDSK